jgi:hypothetical protein
MPTHTNAASQDNSAAKRPKRHSFGDVTRNLTLGRDEAETDRNAQPNCKEILALVRSKVSALTDWSLNNKTVKRVRNELDGIRKGRTYA